MQKGGYDWSKIQVGLHIAQVTRDHEEHRLNKATVHDGNYLELKKRTRAVQRFLFEVNIWLGALSVLRPSQKVKNPDRDSRAL